MAIKKTKAGWRVDLQPEGRGGKRIRKTFPTKLEAEAFTVQQKHLANHNEWKPPVKDKRRLLDLVEDWYALHGHTLRDGAKRKSKMEYLCKNLGNPLARTFTAEAWLEYRNERLKQSVNNRDKTVTPNTVNHEHAYLSALFGTLVKLKNWKFENPMKGISKIKLDESQLTYLELEQIRALLDELAQSKNKDVLKIAKICLATGARWGEAETLQAQNVKQGKIFFVRTKNSKSRAVPISSQLEREILEDKPRFGPLFKGTHHRAFDGAIKRANINLPDGQSTHVLRHTFASHFMINDGNILKLKDILGHQTLTMTLRYAKLAPQHLIDAISKNPLTTLECQQSVNANGK